MTMPMRYRRDMTKSKTSARRLFENFGLSVLSSWVVGPVGVIYLHEIGWGQNHYLLAVMLAFTTLAPLQLLLNDFVAAVSVNNKSDISTYDIMIITLIGTIAAALSIVSANYLNSVPSLIAVSLLSSVSIIISYEISKRFFHGVLYSSVSRLSSSIIGAVPGVTMLAIYIVAGSVRYDLLILLVSIAPALAQRAVVGWKVPTANGGGSGERSPGDRGPIPKGLLYGMLIVLVGIGVLTSFVRSHVAAIDSQYSAIILMSLNLFGTTVVMISRSLYLATGKNYFGTIGLVAVVLALMSLVAILVSPLASMLLLIAALSAAVVVVLAVGRYATSENILKYKIIP